MRNRASGIGGHMPYQKIVAAEKVVVCPVELSARAPTAQTPAEAVALEPKDQTQPGGHPERAHAKRKRGEQ